MKKIISSLLVFALLFSLCGTALASSRQESMPRTIFIDDKEVTILTANEAVKYDIYEVDLAAIAQSTNNRTASIISQILTTCRYTGSMQAGEYTAFLYQPITLANALFNCIDIADVSVLNGYLYISYTTADEKSVILCYCNSGLYDKSIYDQQSDTAIIDTMDSTVQCTNFRNGTRYEMTDELVSLIDAYAAAEDWIALMDIDEISVTIDSDGIVFIDSVYAPKTTRADGFTNDAQMLSHLNTKWPPYTDSLKYSASLYSNALNKNIAIKVQESRNAYTKKTASWGSYAVGTSLTVIATFLTVTGPIAATVLSIIGIALSTTNTILSAATLSRSAVYRYSGSRIGYAYDTTIYNKYVRVIQYSGNGEFTGGYLSNGNFDWVHSTVSSAYDHAYSTIADKTIYNYNADIVVNGFCWSYYPD
jgi:hypothetical protein